ncbi:carbohydrate ABC transporter permease, partial [Streptomyces sp. SID8380]|nr:carbohydrate ABC transporter permease [Streptomyces sp. SID8380]
MKTTDTPSPAEHGEPADAAPGAFVPGQDGPDGPEGPGGPEGPVGETGGTGTAGGPPP